MKKGKAQKSGVDFSQSRADYICLYLDLLGVRSDLFKLIKSHCDCSKKAINEWSAVMRSFMQNAGAIIQAFRKRPQDTFDRVFAPVFGADAAKRNSFVHGCKSLNLGFQQFSDTSMFYLKNDGEVSMMVFRELLLQLVPHIVDAMQYGVVLRGCIAVGDGWLVDTDCLFGPIIEECYNMEQKNVGYSRIVCSDAVAKILADALMHLDQSKCLIGSAQSEFSMFLTDYDGQIVFDYLNPRLLTRCGLVSDASELKCLLQNIRQFALNRYDQARARNEHCVADKYW